MILLEMVSSSATKVGSTSRWGVDPRSCHGDLPFPGPSWSAAGMGTLCFSDGSWSEGCECSLRAPAAAKKSPREEGPCKPSLAFWAWEWEILGPHFPGGKWCSSGGTAGALLTLQLFCYALLSPSLPSFSDFVPIDLEEWWAQQFLAKIENCS